MKIVVLEGYTLNPGDISWSPIEALGDLTVYDRTSPNEAASRIADADAVYISKVPLDAQLMDLCPALKFIGVMATGYNVVDIKEAKLRGIVVTNVPDYATTAVAQHTFALLLSICNRIAEHSASVREGQWTNGPDWCYWNYPIIELHGKTMGIIGLGHIGKAVARIAQAFGMKIYAYDEIQDPLMESDTLRYSSLTELFAASDVITLHCPLSSSTHSIINRRSIAGMRDGVILLNVSRGPLVIEKDLRDALNNGKVYFAGVDVVSTEQIEMNNPLLEAENIYITPHQAWTPAESRSRMMTILADNLQSFQAGTPQNVVNP